MSWSCEIKEYCKERLIDFSGWKKLLREKLMLDFTPPLEKLCEVRKFRDCGGVTLFELPDRKHAVKVPCLFLPDYVCLSTRAAVPEYLESNAGDFSKASMEDWALDGSLLKKTFENGLAAPAGAIYESCELDKEREYACEVLEVNKGEDIYLSTDCGVIVRAPMAADTGLAVGDKASLTFNRRGPVLERLSQLPDLLKGARYEYGSQMLQKGVYGLEERENA